MVGVRVTFHPPQWTWLTDGTVDWFWPEAEKHGLPVMFYGAPMQRFARIAERHPGLPLIADHLGVTGDIVKAGKLSESVGETAALARSENVRSSSLRSGGLFGRAYPIPDMTPHICRWL